MNFFLNVSAERLTPLVLFLIEHNDKLRMYTYRLAYFFSASYVRHVVDRTLCGVPVCSRRERKVGKHSILWY